MIARFLNESSFMLIKNMDKNKMRKIMKNFRIDMDVFFIDRRTSLSLPDGTPGSWFVVNKDKNWTDTLFLSFSHENKNRLGVHSMYVGVAFLFFNDRLNKTDCHEEWFGKVIACSDKKGRKKASLYVKNLMKILSRKNSVSDIIDIIGKESRKHTLTNWSEINDSKISR